MKIGVINNLYPPFNRGGAEIIAQIMVNDLEKLGHEVFVISTSPKAQYQENNVYYLPSKYYNLYKMPLFLRLFWQINNLVDIQRRQRVKEIIEAEKPELIITNNLMGLGLSLPGLFRSKKIKHLHVLHDIQLLHPSGLMFYQKENIINSFLARNYQSLTRKLMGSPQAVISPSKWLLDLHQQKKFFSNSQLVHLPNPVKVNYELGNNDREKNSFLAVGLVAKHKGSDLLIEVFNNLPQFNLTIVGDGSYLEEAKRKAKGNIRFMGRLDNDTVKKLMLQASALIVPSLCYENSPTVIYEAIGSKLPVIGSDLAGVAELISYYGGLLFTPGNANNLKKQIEYFVEHQAEISQHFPQNPLPPDDYAEKLLAL